MKRSIILMFSLLILLTGCNSYSTISLNDVESATIWTHESQRNLTESEIFEFLEQYNSSEYSGKATGEGGTPDFGISMTLNDGNEILVNDFYGKVEVVYADKKAFYLKNEELYELIKRFSGFSKEDNSIVLPADSIDDSYQDTLYDQFNINEKLRYAKVRRDPVCSHFADIVAFTQELSAEKNVILNGTVRTLYYYFTDIDLAENGLWVNPDNLDISSSRDIYTDSDHNIYGFDSEYGTFKTYLSNSLFVSDELDDEGQLTNEQAKNIVIDFIKDLTTEENYQDLEVTLSGSGIFRVDCETSDEYSRKSSIVSSVSLSGVIRYIHINIFQNGSVSIEQIKATDEKLGAYIDENYKNIESYTFSRTINIVKGTPAIYYSVTFTETDGKYKANFVELIVLKLVDCILKSTPLLL